MGCYAGRFAVSDHSAATHTLVVNQGDDYRDVLQFVSVHKAPDGSCVEVPIDLAGVSFDSAVRDGAGQVVAAFSFTQTGDPGTVEVTLGADETATMAPGSYEYFIKTRDAAAKVKTRVRGIMEVCPR